MKAVFVGELVNPGGSGVQRLWALRQCGVEVVAVDTGDFPSRLGSYSGHVARVLRRPRLGRNSAALERSIAEACDQHKPDLVWFEWPKTFRPVFFDSLRSAERKPFLVSFQDDNPFGDRSGDVWQWKNYLTCASRFDLHLVKRPEDVENLARYGARGARLWIHGIYSPLYHPIENGEKTIPVSFVGTCMDDRASFLEYLISEVKLPVHVFGSRWDTRSDLPRRFPDHFHGAVWGESYARVLQTSYAAIGFVSHSNHDEWTMRTFEVPGCETALIAEKTPSHTAWFEEGSEALFFSNREECAEKIRVILDNRKAGLEMARMGRRKCLEKGWMIEHRMAEFLAEFFPGAGSKTGT